MTNKLVIAGGSGFIGTNACIYFAEKGYEVYSMDWARPRINIYEYGNVAFRQVNLVTPVATRRSMPPNFDYVLYLAYRSKHQDPDDEIVSNIKMLVNILHNLKDKSLTKFVYMSSSSIYTLIHSDDNYSVLENQQIIDDNMYSPNVYCYTKMCLETLVRFYCKLYGIPYTIVRGFEIYGKYPTSGIVKMFMKQAAEGKITLFCHGKQTADFTHVNDLCSAFETVLHHDEANGKVIPVATHNIHTYAYLATLLEEFTMCEIESLPCREGEQPFKLYSASTELEKLGWKPKYSLAKGIADLMEHP